MRLVNPQLSEQNRLPNKSSSLHVLIYGVWQYLCHKVLAFSRYFFGHQRGHLRIHQPHSAVLRYDFDSAIPSSGDNHAHGYDVYRRLCFFGHQPGQLSTSHPHRAGARYDFASTVPCPGEDHALGYCVYWRQVSLDLDPLLVDQQADLE